MKRYYKKYNFDVIIHFAPSLIVPESVEKPLKYYLNNTTNTTNLVNLANKYKVKKFIFSSTAKVYGKLGISKIKNGISEEFRTVPINPYGQIKLFSEKIIQDAAKVKRDFKYAVFRYFNVVGAAPDLIIGQKTKKATHLINVVAECAIGKRDKIYIVGNDYPAPDKTGVRDYIHVMDLADAHVKGFEYLENNESDIFNVGYGKGISVKEVINTMKEVSRVDFEVEYSSRRVGDPSMLIAKNDEIVKRIGWEPKYNDLKEICKSAYEWEKKI